MHQNTSLLITCRFTLCCGDTIRFSGLRHGVIEHQCLSGGTDDFNSSECGDGKTV